MRRNEISGKRCSDSAVRTDARFPSVLFYKLFLFLPGRKDAVYPARGGARNATGLSSPAITEIGNADFVFACADRPVRNVAFNLRNCLGRYGFLEGWSRESFEK